MKFTDLRGADLSGTDLTGANFENARVHGAVLADATLNDLPEHLVDLSPTGDGSERFRRALGPSARNERFRRLSKTTARGVRVSYAPGARPRVMSRSVVCEAIGRIVGPATAALIIVGLLQGLTREEAGGGRSGQDDDPRGRQGGVA